MAVGSIPPAPALGAWPDELSDRIAAGELAAKGYFHPATGLALLGQLYHANGFYDEALQCYDGLRQLRPGEARWPHFMASILAGLGQLAEAQPLWEQAGTLAPGYIPARLRLGDLWLKRNRPQDAARVYAAVLTQSPADPYALLGLARCDLAAADWKKAGSRLQEAIAAHPDFIGALSLLVTIHEHSGEETVANALKAAVGKREFVDVFDPWLDGLFDYCYDPYRLSVAAAQAKAAGDAEKARRWLERAIGLAPANGSYHRQLGKILFQSQDYDRARRQLDKAVAVSPDDSDAWGLLIEILTALGDVGATEQALAAGLVHCPQSPGLHFTRGQRLSTAGRMTEAITELKLSISLRPNAADPYVVLALAYFRLSRIDEAIAELERALAAQPGHPLAMEILARHAVGTGDEAAARHWIHELRLLPRVPAEDLRIIAGEYQQRFGRAPW